MASKRAAAVATTIGDAVFVAGGFNGAQILANTEYLQNGQPSEAGPDMPEALMSHCMVDIDDDTVMVIGKHDML